MRSADLTSLVAIASLLVGVVSGVYTALGYYAQRKPLSSHERRLAIATRPWQAMLGVAAIWLVVAGLLDAVTSMPVAWVRAGYGAGLAIVLTALLGRWWAARACRAQLAHQEAEQAAATEAATKQQRVAAVEELLAGMDPDGRPPTVGDQALPMYDRWVGVARSRYATTGADPYIPRLVADKALQDALIQVLAGSRRKRLILIIGPSKAGKTRSALEGLRRHDQLRSAPLLSLGISQKEWITTDSPEGLTRGWLCWLDLRRRGWRCDRAASGDGLCASWRARCHERVPTRRGGLAARPGGAAGLPSGPARIRPRRGRSLLFPADGAPRGGGRPTR